MVLCGISRCFHLLSPCLGQIVHALLTRPPLEVLSAPAPVASLRSSSFLPEVRGASRVARCFRSALASLPQLCPALGLSGRCRKVSPLDLHVLSTPPAFVLSQDQTLVFNPLLPASCPPRHSPESVLTHQNLTVLSSRFRCIVFKNRTHPRRFRLRRFSGA